MKQQFKKKILTQSIGACLIGAALLSQHVMASDLINASVNNVSEYQTEFIFEFSDDASLYDFQITNNFPVIDFNLNNIQVLSNSINEFDINNANIDNVNQMNSSDGISMNFLVNTHLAYKKDIVDNRLVVTLYDPYQSDLESDNFLNSPEFDETFQPQVREVVTNDNNAVIINSIDYENTASTYRIILNTENNFTSSISRSENKIFININDLDKESVNNVINNLNIPDDLFTVSVDRNNRIVIELDNTKHVDYRSFQIDSQLTVEMFLVGNRQTKIQAPSNFYKGQLIDLNFQDIPVRNVLNILADIAGLNMVISESVRGNISLKLQNTPWDQAMGIVLRSHNLDQRTEGNVVLVGTLSELSEREMQEINTLNQQKDNSPLSKKRIQINYRAASLIRGLVEEANLKSERGTLVADDQTNQLFISDHAKNISDIEKFIKDIDIEIGQVMIEAKLITTTSEFAKELGIRWGAQHTATINGNSLSLGGGAGTVGGIGSMVDLGVTSASSVLNIGYISSDVLLSAELSALQSDSKVEIISQPKVITSNGNAASIRSGQEVAYQVVSDGDVGVEFKEVALTLDVTPHINPGDVVTLNIEINQDSLAPNPFGSELLINKNSLNTIVSANNGETIVLGGVFRTDTETENHKTPFLGDLPFVGQAFRYRAEKETVRELLIFITPRLIRTRQD